MDLTRLMLACGRAFIFSFVLTPITRDVFRSYNVVDRPGRRKVHAYPIPRVGGVPIVVAYVFALTSLRGPDTVFPVHWLQAILSGTLLIFLTGLIDDFLNLPPVVKLLGQIAAAVVAYSNGLSIDNIGGIGLPGWLSLAATVFWLLLTTNALNLIDGLDGLCSGIAFWATLAFVAVGATHDGTILVFTALPLAGALLGFLFFNFNPATVFLGDSGALTIGFLLGIFGIVWSGHRVTATGLAVPFLALCVPMVDLGLSIVRRRLRGKPIFSADREHIHHRLLDRGLGVRRAVLFLYGASIFGGIAGLFLSYPVRSHPGREIGFRLIVLAGVLATGLTAVGKLRYAEFEVAGRLLFRGELKKTFAAKLRMEQLARSLERAANAEEWWLRLVEAGREWNWLSLKWLRGNHEAVQEALATGQPCWNFRIDVGEAGFIEVAGDERPAAGNAGPDLTVLSAILIRTAPHGSRESEQPVLSPVRPA